MRKDRKAYLGVATAVDLIVLLSGVIVVLAGGYAPASSIEYALCQAIGTSLIAAGLVTFLIRQFRADPPHPNDHVELLAGTRTEVQSHFVSKKYSCHELDILAIALTNMLEELATDRSERALKRVMFDGAKMRLMFLSPAGVYVLQRAFEDSASVADLQRTLKQAVARCELIHERLSRMYDKAVKAGTYRRDQAGVLEIRVFDVCPYLNLYRADDEILWGLYTSTRPGQFSSVLRVTTDLPVLHGQLTSHFEGLWNSRSGSGKDNPLLSFHGFSGPPSINESLAKSLLDAPEPTRKPQP